MKNVLNCLTLLFFNSVFSQGNITTTFPKTTLNTVSQPQIQSLNTLIIDYLRDVWTNNLFSTTIFNVNDFLLKKNRISGHLHKSGTFPINIIG